MTDDGLTEEQIREAYNKKEREVREPKRKAHAVLNLHISRLKSFSDPLSRSDEMSIVDDVLVGIAKRTGEPGVVLSFASEFASEIASETNIPGGTEKIRAGILQGLQDLQKEAVQDAGVDRDSVDGVGIDEFVEDRLVNVTKKRNTDHVDDPSFVFEFVGCAFELPGDGDWTRSYTSWLDIADKAAEVTLMGDFASLSLLDNEAFEQMEGDVKEKGTETNDAYRKASLGPEARPWGIEWEPCIKDVIAEHVDTNPDKSEIPKGPRTEAFENVLREIKDGQVTTSREDAVAQDAIWIDEDRDEVAVPTTIIDDCCEDIACNRSKMVYELDARDVGTDRLSGVSISEPESAVGREIDMWRLDATRDCVREMVPVDPPAALSAGGTDNLMDGEAGAGAAADGGIVYSAGPVGDSDGAGENGGEGQ